MTKQKELSNIFSKDVCDKAELKLLQIQDRNESSRRYKESINKRNEKIRLCLLNKICPECGDEIRYRCSFNPIEWFYYYPITICICKSCGDKKKLIY